ncbi:exonuclease SbcCD subunit D [Sinorhizobium sp. BG8]|uniref:metallophosphoesterase family protein n=1 Tax=Sinorhizobium sp. BG8 TaxID=2613773 RepID=UPI00193DED72|nr:exonuclease SbcCD subunit D [Sinorhizobium sp. BG8]QRM56879.1 exonuclease SbcCD subunit D [Sinorhizobium sp. BG8]
MPFRFVHTADLHLDSPIASLALRNGELADLIRGATRRTLERIVDLCIAERVDALLVAGDLYDGSQTSMATALFLTAQFRRLEQAGIRIFLIRGNHDAQSQITRELTFPANVHVFDGRGKPVVAGALEDGRAVNVHGISFAQPHAPSSLLPSFRGPVVDAVNIGMLHTSLGGSLRHDPYAPCTVADLTAHGFDYWALGHIHQRSQHLSNPWIVMPGIPQGRDINEAGPKSVTLVTVSDDAGISVEEHQVAVAVFERLRVDLDGIEDWGGMLDAVERRASHAKREAGDVNLVMRIDLAGTTPLAWRLRRDEDLLAGELQNIAAAIGDCWIEKVELSVHAPLAPAGQGGLDPVLELGGLMRDDVLASHAFQSELREMLSDLLRQLPKGARELLADDEQAQEALLAEIAAEGSEDVLARLASASAEASG